MMEFDSRELACLISIVLLLSCRRLSACFFMRYLMRRRFQRWRLLAMIQQSTAVLTRQIRRRDTRARAHRSVWSLPRPQLWFERLLNDRLLDGWWKENFRVSRATFEYICRLVGPALSRQSESYGYSFRREVLCHLARMKSAKKLLRLGVAIKRSTLIGSFTSGIKTPFQLTTLNVMGGSCDLFDVSMNI